MEQQHLVDERVGDGLAQCRYGGRVELDAANEAPEGLGVELFDADLQRRQDGLLSRLPRLGQRLKPRQLISPACKISGRFGIGGLRVNHTVACSHWVTQFSCT